MPVVSSQSPLLKSLCLTHYSVWCLFFSLRSFWLGVNLVEPPPAQRFPCLKILLDVFVIFVSCPIRWRPLSGCRILHIRPCAMFHQQANDLVVAPCGSLVQGRRMGM